MDDTDPKELEKQARRENALAELKRQIVQTKSRLDPSLLEKMAALAAASAKQGGKAPYDRAAAAKAVELFLSSHGDEKGLRQRLLSFIQKKSQ